MLKGVQLDDRRMLWWLQGGVPASIRDDNGEGKWCRGSWKCLDAAAGADAELVKELLVERETLRKQQDFIKSDLIHARLTVDMGVQIDDKKRTWKRAGIAQ
jgi:hypothetical protein